jgi:hypothetical protein
VTYDERYAPQNYVLIGIMLALVITVPVLLLYTIGLVAYRSWKRRTLLGTALRCLGFLSICFAAFTYFWGCLSLIPDERSADELCRANVPPRLARNDKYYEVSFVPLKSKCRVKNGDTYDITGNPTKTSGVVPSYVNPAVAVATGVAIAAFVAVRRFPDEDPSQPEPAEGATS